MASRARELEATGRGSTLGTKVSSRALVHKLRLWGCAVAAEVSIRALNRCYSCPCVAHVALWAQRGATQRLKLHGLARVQFGLARADKLVDHLRDIVAERFVVLGTLRRAHKARVARYAQRLVGETAERVPRTHGTVLASDGVAEGAYGAGSADSRLKGTVLRAFITSWT